MNRRTFLKALAAVPLAAVMAPAQGLAFHPDAFAFVSAPFSRMDVLYGVGYFRPEFACRVTDACANGSKCLPGKKNYRHGNRRRRH